MRRMTLMVCMAAVNGRWYRRGMLTEKRFVFCFVFLYLALQAARELALYFADPLCTLAKFVLSKADVDDFEVIDIYVVIAVALLSVSLLLSFSVINIVVVVVVVVVDDATPIDVDKNRLSFSRAVVSLPRLSPNNFPINIDTSCS